MLKKGKRKARYLMSLAVSSVLLLGAIPVKPHAAYAQASTESLLANLTPEQRNALQNLERHELKTGLRLSQEVDVTSTEEVSVIVEFKELPAKVAQTAQAAKGEKLSLQAAADNVEQSHVQFKKHLQEKIGKNEKSGKDDYQIQHTYKYALNGVALSLPANQIEKLLQSDVVKAVYSNKQVHITPPIQIDGEANETKVDSISFLKIDQLHKEGFTGKGIKIGVLDTGIDYHHPDLKDAYKGGYDFVDSDSNPMEATYDDWKKSGKQETMNGSTYYTSHGTHVSGTIAGRAKNTSDHKVLGIAPDSELYMYRVLGPYGSGATANIIAAIDKTITDGMDIINLSLGSFQNDPLSPASLAIDNAVLSGITAVVAAGNEGDMGMYTLGSPGAAALALTVGASSASIQVTTFESRFEANGTQIEDTLQLMTKKWTDDFRNLSGKIFEMVNVGLGGAQDYIGKDVKGKIAFAARGTYALAEKMYYAQQNGAAGIIIYNSNPTEGHIPHYLGESNSNIPVFSLSNKAGVAVHALFTNGGTPTISLGTTGTANLPGDELASFSSKGPSGTLYDIKPEVTAPGVTVLSTVPSYINSKNNTSDYSSAYLRMSGTSMASPHVAGIAALLLQAHPEYTPADIKTALMNTADPLKGTYSVFETGAGRVDPYEAIHADTEIAVLDKTPYMQNGEQTLIEEETGGLSYGFIPVGDAPAFTDKKTVSITNNGDKTTKYELSVVYNIGVQGSLDPKKNGVIVKLSDTSIVVQKHRKKELGAYILVPKTAKRGTYEGYIHIVNKHNPEEAYQIPFGMRVVDEGLDYFKVHTPSFSTNRIRNPYSVKATDLDFKFNSSMQTLDFILVDAKSNKDLGLITSIYTAGAAIDFDYYLSGAFSGRYYPFTGNAKKPVGYTSVLAPDGVYKIKAVGTNLSGKQFIYTDYVYLDNSAPALTLDQTNAMPKGELPFVELAPGQSTVTLSGTVIDNEVGEMNTFGINVTQGNNKVYYGTYGPNYSITTDQNGRFTKEIVVAGPGTVQAIQMTSGDRAGNSLPPQTIYYIKAGTQYFYAKPNQKAITMGDKVTYTFYSHGLQNAKEFSFTLDYVAKYFDSVEFRKHASLPENTEFKVTTKGTTSLSNTVNMKVTGDALNGDVPLFDIIADTKAEEFIPVLSQLFNAYNAYYKDVNGTTVRPYTQVGLLPIYTPYSKIQAQLGAEGLYKEDGSYNYTMDYTAIGATVKAQDAKGNIYNADIQKNGQIYINQLPAAEQVYTVMIDVPGHFATYAPLEIGRKEAGYYAGESIFYYTIKSKAGDVNKDNVIDIHDAILMKTHWETSNRNTDINFDGKTDAKDFKLMELNYLKQNDYVVNTPEPQQSYQGETITSIKSILGIN